MRIRLPAANHARIALKSNSVCIRSAYSATESITSTTMPSSVVVPSVSRSRSAVSAVVW